MAVKHKRKIGRYLPPISGIDKNSRAVIEYYLRELNKQAKLPKDAVLTITTYRVGRRKYYQVVIKRVSDGAIIEELGSFPKSSLISALKFAFHLLKKK